MKWTADHAEQLANRSVLIVPDNDKAGRDHAESVAQSLWGVAASIKILELPGLSAKGDVSDWIAAGGTHDQLKQIADATDEWRFGGAAKDPARRIEVIHARDFATHDYRPNWLVKRVLVAGQPAVCGGRSKAMKTSNLVDLAVSLGTGTPFLGHFDTDRTTVAILSGESGAFTIQETAKRVAQARGVSLADADVYFVFTLPYITRLADVDATARMIEEVHAKVLIVDPAYLCLLGGDAGGRQASNVFDMGPLLLRLSDIGNKTGSTIILCHHCKKTTDMSREKFDPPDLEELSMAGFHEWARQWLLIGRRERFEPGTGLHKLWLNVGGSVGFSGTWSVDIDEGVIADDFSGRKWDVSVGSMTDAAEEKKREQDRKADEKRRATEWDREVKVTKALRVHKEGLTRRQLREETGLNAPAIASAVMSLFQKRGAIEVDGMSGNRPCKVIILTDQNYQPEMQTASTEPGNYEHAFDAYAPQTPDF
jgi:replicative DNA helicase